MAKGEARYHTLDAMRGIAALLVVVFHLQQRITPNHQIPGYLAVDLFFALSGFVIAANYQQRFATGLTLAKFVEVRLVRLYPLYALGLLLGVARQLFGLVIHDQYALPFRTLLTTFMLNGLMIPSTTEISLYPLNGPSWSLFFELVVNILFGFYLWKAKSWMIFIFVAFFGFALCFTISAPSFFNVGWSWDQLEAGISRTMFSFSVGILIFRFFGHRPAEPSFLAFVPIVLMALCMMITAPFHARLTIELGMVLLLFPALIIMAIRFDLPPVARKLGAILGDVSYPAYALHWPILTLYRVVTPRFISATMAEITSVIGMFAVGYLASRFFDAPLRAAVTKKLRLRRSAMPQATVPVD